MKLYNYIFNIVILLSIFIKIVLFVGCETNFEPVGSDNLIILEISGGFWGVYHKISIDNSGLASYESIYPTLQLQLSDEEFTEIKSYLKNFDTYQDSYPGGCIDCYYYKITLKTNKWSKSVEFDESSIRNYSELKKLANLISILGQLRIRIYNEKATWTGLTYQFSMNSSVYSQNDSIIFSCTIINSTDNERCIYFKNKYKIQIAISNDTHDPHIQFWIPEYLIAMTETESPSKIILDPGEKKIIKKSWDQDFTNYNDVNYTELPIGKYKATIHLLGGYTVNGGHPISNYIVFEIK